jgi:glycosyltransferase involved in cell wall biosynthesis
MVHYRRAGGIGQYVASLLAAMARSPLVGQGSLVQVLQMRGDTQALVPGDPRFRRVPLWTPPHNRFEQPALVAELLALRPKPQLIHSPDFVPPRFRRFPAVVNIQDLAFLKFPDMTLLTGQSKRYYGQVRHAARDAEAVIALSESARDDIVQLLGVSPGKVAVIPAAAGEEFRPPDDLGEAQRWAAQHFGLPTREEGGYILFVSTIEPRKNLPMLFEAYRLLIERGRAAPVPALALAGPEGWLYERVYARMDELKLREHVRLLGGVSAPDLVGLYQGACLFALPSLYEGFGLPALEALACGVPVLASTGGSLPEVVGDAGILLDPHDADAWADAIERVLLDPAESQRMRDAGPKQAANFSWDRAAAQTWELYARVAT